MALGTSIDIYQQTKPFPTMLIEGESDEDSSLAEILKCFSININGKIILNTEKKGGDHLGCLNGIRYFKNFLSLLKCISIQGLYFAG